MTDLQIAYTVIGALVGLVGLVEVGRRVRRRLAAATGRVTGALDNLGGRAAFVDNATGKLVPAIPPLGERLTRIEETLVGLANVNGRLDGHELRLNDHDATLGALIGEKYERGAHAALTAVEKAQADVTDVESKETKP